MLNRNQRGPGVSDSKAAKRGPAPRLQQHLEQISQPPGTRQRFVMEVLDTVIHQAS